MDGQSDYDVSRAIRFVRDHIIEWAARHESKTPYIIKGQATGDPQCPSNPLFAVPLWYIFRLNKNPKGTPVEQLERIIPKYPSAEAVEVLYKLLCEVSLVFTEGLITYAYNKEYEAFFRRIAADAIPKFGTSGIIALPYQEATKRSSYLEGVLSHEIRHAADSVTNHWSMRDVHPDYSKDHEVYYKDPSEIRARVTEVGHSAEDVIHALVAQTTSQTATPEQKASSLRILTDIFGSGAAVFSSWLYGLLTPFHKGDVSLVGDTEIPRPTLDISLTQVLLKITASAYSKTSSAADKKEQQDIQEWMASYSKSLYNYLVNMYKTKLPMSVFHEDRAKTEELWSIAHKNLVLIKQELPRMQW